ncbi:MAG: dUTP diphosphatase [Christensenellales bacterium]
MNSKMNRVKIYSKSGELPRYETENSAGLDLRALLDEPMIIKPMERVLIPTGIFLEIPNGFEGQVRARSGLSIKHGLTMVNGVGTVDSDYRGELKVPMINLGSEEFKVESGDRIAQIVFAKYETVSFEAVSSTEELEKTERGAGGFGHTGR